MIDQRLVALGAVFAGAVLAIGVATFVTSTPPTCSVFNRGVCSVIVEARAK